MSALAYFRHQQFRAIAMALFSGSLVGMTYMHTVLDLGGAIWTAVAAWVSLMYCVALTARLCVVSVALRQRGL